MSGKSTSHLIQQRSAKLCRFITAVLVVLAVLLLLERFGAIGLKLARNGFTGDPLRLLALQFVRALPELLYLLALWWIRQALAGFSRGELYSPTICRMLNRVGNAVAAGAVIAVFLLPGFAAALGSSPGYLIAYDVSSLVLGALGLSLKVIAHILAKASEAQAELDEIF